MKLRSLFDHSASYGSLYATIFVNRIQVLYLVLLIPSILVEPYMLWVILGVGLLSQFVLLLYSRFLKSESASTGYQGYVRLFGARTLRGLIGFGLIFLFVKMSVFTLGAVEIVHQYIFPSMSPYLLISFLYVAGCYLAAHGMDNMVRLVIIVFMGTFWVFFMFLPFFLPPIASVSDLYPLIPADWSTLTWTKMQLVLGALSGPEYLVCLTPWIQPQKKQTFPFWTLGNVLSMLEYLLLFAASLLFYGSEYLGKTKHAVVNMIRYLQSPVFERIDIILISTHLFNFIYFIALFLLFIYGGFRAVAGRKDAKTTPLGFWTCSISVLVYLFAVYKWFWESGLKLGPWVSLQLWFGMLGYLGVPVLLLFAMRRKGDSERCSGQ